jgi:hypothetical protein
MTYPQQPGGWNDPSIPAQQPAAQPDPTLPVSAQPVSDQPAYGQPAYGQPAYGQPAYGQPTYGQPVTGESYPGYPPAGYTGYGYPAGPRTNGMAIAALVLSLVGIASCITAPIGAILGHVARKQIRERGEGGEGMATAAIIVGWILTGLLVLLIAFYVVMIVIAVNNPDTFSN